LSAKAFGLKIFSRDDSQGIKTDGKHGGFVDRMQPKIDKIDPKLFSSLQTRAARLISSGFTQLLRSSQ